MNINGIIVVNKKEGITSRTVVNDVSHIFETKKVGHTGTLDPLATGVLVVTIGRYTKLNEALMSTYKEYIAEFKLGVLTDTLDITGNVLNEEKTHISENRIREVINSYRKEYEQTVPLYSSVKINGKKLYEYAREKREVDLPKRMVDIKEIEVLEINKDIIKIRTLVSKGTYIRSLIRDIGLSLETNATMVSLVRTKQGIFGINDAYSIEDIRNHNYKLLSIEEAMDVEVVECDDDLLKRVINGSKLDKTYNKEYVLFKYKNEEISLYKSDIDYYRMYLAIKLQEN